MSRLVEVALFAAGMYACLRLIAASYRVLDLWYTIRTAYPRVVRGIAIWGGLAVFPLLVLDGRRRMAFVLGLLAFLAFYLSLYVLRHLVLPRAAPLE
jgi:hypothetical protein